MCDGMLIPALVLAKRDRHRNAIDAPTEQFIFHTVTHSELIVRADASLGPGKQTGHDRNDAPAPQGKVICLAARDEADEIAGSMLVQALRQRRGWNAETIGPGAIAETRR